MPGTIINGYCTLLDLKSSDVLKTPVSAGDDAFLSDIITAVSRGIDTQTGRHFYVSAADETHYFTAKTPNELFVGDLVSITTLANDLGTGLRTYSTIWAATDYDLWPYDATFLSEPAPYRFILTTPAGVQRFYPNIAKDVKIIGKFGWPAVPSLIAKACLLWSARLFMRYKSPLGVSASNAFGTSQALPPPDPDIEAMISNYKVNAV